MISQPITATFLRGIADGCHRGLRYDMPTYIFASEDQNRVYAYSSVALDPQAERQLFVAAENLAAYQPPWPTFWVWAGQLERAYRRHVPILVRAKQHAARLPRLGHGWVWTVHELGGDDNATEAVQYEFRPRYWPQVNAQVTLAPELYDHGDEQT